MILIYLTNLGDIMERHDRSDIQITKEMLKAGLDAYAAWNPEWGVPDDLIESIYRAMWRARIDQVP